MISQNIPSLGSRGPPIPEEEETWREGYHTAYEDPGETYGYGKKGINPTK